MKIFKLSWFYSFLHTWQETLVAPFEEVIGQLLPHMVIKVSEPAKPEPDKVISKPPPKLPWIGDVDEIARLYVNLMLLFEFPFDITWTIAEYVPALFKPVVHVIWVLEIVWTAHEAEPIKTFTASKYIDFN